MGGTRSVGPVPSTADQACRQDVRTHGLPPDRPRRGGARSQRFENGYDLFDAPSATAARVRVPDDDAEKQNGRLRMKPSWLGSR